MMEMPLMKVVEGVLAVFGSMKFCHETFEVLSHLVKLARRTTWFK